MLSWRFRLVLALVFSGTLIPSAFVSAQGFLQCSGALDCTLCAGVTVMQLIINGAIIIAFPVAAVLFTYAGGLMMTSAANPSGIQKAKDIFKSVGIGFAFVLCGWIIVDTIIHVVVINQNTGYFQNSSWNTVGTCSANRPLSAPVSQLLNGLFAPSNPNASPVAVDTGAPTGAGIGGGATAQCDPGNTACNTATLSTSGLSAAQAAAMSCIAMTESGGGTNIDNGSGTGCNSSNHCGVYQLSSDLMNTYAASGCSVQQIKFNANNCNVLTAVNVFNKSGYQPWTGGGSNPWNPSARSCVNQYDPSASNKGF